MNNQTDVRERVAAKGRLTQHHNLLIVVKFRSRRTVSLVELLVCTDC